jgi:hypothetical protein
MAPRLCLLATLMACSCQLLAGFPAAPDADVDASTIVTVTGSLGDAGPYPAGSSVVLDLDATWDGPPREGVDVGIRATRGLVSDRNAPGSSSRFTTTTDANGTPRPVRITFPLDPWPYTVQLAWGTGEADDTPLDGVSESLEVVEPELYATRVIGTGDAMQLPAGLVAEEYLEVGTAFDLVTGDNLELNSMTFAWDDTSTTLVVSGGAETCFFTTDQRHVCHRTRPENTDTEKPDLVHRVVFYDSSDSARGLYLAAFCGDESEAGCGLYSLSPEGATARVVDSTNLSTAHPAPTGTAFRPENAPGLYYFAQGDLSFYDPREGSEDRAVCPQVRIWPVSMAIGDPDLYQEPYVFLMDYRPGPEAFRRVSEMCLMESILTDLDWNGSSVTLRPAPGAVFGRTVYLATGEELQLLIPDIPADGYQLFSLIGAADAIHPIDVASPPLMPGADVHPPGLYVLDGTWNEARILRIYQDL